MLLWIIDTLFWILTGMITLATNYAADYLETRVNPTTQTLEFWPKVNIE